MSDYFARALRPEPGADEAQLIEAQVPIERPAPIPRPEPRLRPGNEPPASGPQRFAPRQPMAPMPPAGMPAPAQSAPAAPAPAGETDYFSRAIRPPATGAVAEPTGLQRAPPFPGYQDPKTEGWAESIGKSISGRQDPRYQGIPSFEEAMLAENNEPALKSMRFAAPFVTSDTGLANIVRRSLGERFVRTEADAYGAPVLVYRGQDGKETKAYLNKPGLDREDIGRGIVQAIPYVLTGGLVGGAAKNAGLALNALLQGGGAASTSITTDLVGALQGSGEGIDTKKAAIVGGLSAGGGLLAAGVGALWRKFVTEPSLYNSATGQLTPKGVAAAQQAGLDPAILPSEIAREFAKEYAKNGTRIGRSLATREFGIDQSRGQATKDPGQLLAEKAMRTGGYGETGKDIIQSLDRRQAGQIEAAARGDGTTTRSVAAELAPGTPAQGSSTQQMGTAVRSAAREAEQAAEAEASAAWRKVGRLEPTPEAVAELPTHLAPRLGSLPLDEKLTPTAVAMVKDLRGFMGGKVPGEFADVVGRQAVPDAIEMRKRLFQVMRSAESPTDKAAARAIYEGYGDWIEQSAATAINNGNPLQAAALRLATDKTRELKAIFGDTAAGGLKTPGRRIVGEVLAKEGEASPERVIASLFTADAGATPRAGAVEALGLLKQGFEKYMPPERAASAWADLKLAYWKRLIEDSAGNLHTPAMMAKRIDQAMMRQSSVVNTLLTPEERSLVRRFGQAMRDVAWRDPNPSGTGTANQFYGRQFGQALFRMLGASNGPIGLVVSTLLRSTPVLNAAGAVAAQRAITPSIVRPPQSSLPAAIGAVGGRRSQD